MLDMVICIQMDAGCNETTPTISFDRSHGDLNMMAKNGVNVYQQLPRVITNCRIRKELNTIVKSVTFATLEAAVAFVVIDSMLEIE